MSKNFFFEPLPNDKDCEFDLSIISRTNQTAANWQRKDIEEELRDGVDKVYVVNGTWMMPGGIVWAKTKWQRQMALWSGSGCLLVSDGADCGVYVGKIGLDNAGQCVKRYRFLFDAGIDGLSVGMDAVR